MSSTNNSNATRRLAMEWFLQCVEGQAGEQCTGTTHQWLPGSYFADFFTFPYPVPVSAPSPSNDKDLNYCSVTVRSISVKATLRHDRFTSSAHLILNIFPFADSKHVSAGLKQTDSFNPVSLNRLRLHSLAALNRSPPPSPPPLVITAQPQPLSN